MTETPLMSAREERATWNWSAFGEHVLRERIKQDRSRKDVADYAGVAPRTLEKIEVDHEPALVTTVARIEYALGKPLGWARHILRHGEPPTPTPIDVADPANTSAPGPAQTEGGNTEHAPTTN